MATSGKVAKLTEHAGAAEHRTVTRVRAAPWPLSLHGIFRALRSQARTTVLTPVSRTTA
jgi:hypothetical protein